MFHDGGIEDIHRDMIPHTEPHRVFVLGTDVVKRFKNPLLRKYAQVKIMDANALNQDFEDIETEIKEFRPNAVIFSASLPSFSADMQVAKIAKKIDKNSHNAYINYHSGY